MTTRTTFPVSLARLMITSLGMMSAAMAVVYIIDNILLQYVPWLN